jgi:protein TonB
MQANSILPEGKEDAYKPFAEVMPTPIGGLEAINKKIVYPEIAKNAGIEGKVYLLVFINESGNVDDAKVIKGIGAGCDEAAVEAVKETKFSPGKNNGEAVKVKLSLPFLFKLH